MWKADQAGGATFSDFNAPSPVQGSLFEPEPDYAQLKELLMSRFAGRLRVADFRD